MSKLQKSLQILLILVTIIGIALPASSVKAEASATANFQKRTVVNYQIPCNNGVVSHLTTVHSGTDRYAYDWRCNKDNPGVREVFAPHAGVVKFAKVLAAPTGGMVMIYDQENDVCISMIHLESNFLVSVGDKVTTSTQIGKYTSSDQHVHMAVNPGKCTSYVHANELPIVFNEIGSVPPQNITLNTSVAYTARINVDSSSSIAFVNGFSKIDINTEEVVLRVSGDNINGRVVYWQMWRAATNGYGERVWNGQGVASGNSIIFKDLDGAGPVFKDVTYYTVASLSPIGADQAKQKRTSCAVATDFKMLCDSVSFASKPPDPVAQCPAISEWKGEYWNNKDLSGSPALCRNDANVDFSWEFGGPGTPINVDNFSARWTRELDFAEGKYQFYLKGDDGIRLWIDGKQIINQWKDQGITEYSAQVDLIQGKHTIKVEYYENSGGATVGLRWEKISGLAPVCVPGKSVDDSFMLGVIDKLNTQTEYQIQNTEFAVKVLRIWQRYENTNACWNPLATTWGWSGATNFNSVGVKNYVESAHGISATANTIGTKNTAASYAAIRKMLALQGFDEAGIAANLKIYSGGGGYVTNLMNEWRTLYNNTKAVPMEIPNDPVAVKTELSCPATAQTGSSMDCTLSINPDGSAITGLQINLDGMNSILKLTGTKFEALAGNDPINLSTDTKVVWAGSNGATIEQSGVLATLTFDVLQAGTAEITGTASAVNAQNAAVTSSFVGASISVEVDAVQKPDPNPEPTNVGTIRGKASLSYGNDASSVTAALVDNNGQVVASTLLNADGSYQLSAPLAAYILKLNAPGYLRAEKQITLVDAQNMDVGSVTLLAGDINGDDKINPSDLISLGAAYDVLPLTLHAADWNKDGVINIFDLIIFAQNYRKTGPIAW